MVEADQSEIAGPHSEADQIVLKIHSHELRSFFPNYSDQIAHKPPVFPNIYGLLTFDVMRKIYFSPSLLHIISTEPMCFPENISTMAEVHQAIQGVDPAITGGLREDLVRFIGTSFSTTPEERIRYVAAMREEAAHQGVQVEIISNQCGKRL